MPEKTLISCFSSENSLSDLQMHMPIQNMKCYIVNHTISLWQRQMFTLNGSGPPGSQRSFTSFINCFFNLEIPGIRPHACKMSLSLNHTHTLSIKQISRRKKGGRKLFLKRLFNSCMLYAAAKKSFSRNLLTNYKRTQYLYTTNTNEVQGAVGLEGVTLVGIALKNYI